MRSAAQQSRAEREEERGKEGDRKWKKEMATQGLSGSRRVLENALR